MTTNININEKRIITNEDLCNLIINQNTTIAENKKELHDAIVNSFDTVFKVIDGFRVELKQDISDLRVELKQDISDLRVELKQDISDLRVELKQDISDLRTELKQDISDLRTELKQDINDLRVELKDDIFDLRKDMNQRFSIVDGRFTGLENNVAYKHQLLSKFA